MKFPLDASFLPAGALAPNFSLITTAGETITRGQFRNRAGLLLVFAFTANDPMIAALCTALAADTEVYHKLNMRCFIVTRTASESALPLLIDADGAAWHAYSGSDAAQTGYGVFVLDLYGGVDSQIVTPDPAALPDAETILAWARSAMYRCSI